MSTFAEITDGVLLSLSGFSNSQDQATYLTSSVTNSALSLAVADVSAISRGMVEIDDELIWIDTVSASGATATIPPYGRGYRSTTAASHNSGARVTSQPLFPRSFVKRAINETIQAVWPSLYGIGTTSFTYLNGTYTYEMPAGAESAVQVQWQQPGYTTEWKNVRRYSIDSNADTTVFPSGSSITVNDPIIAGRTVRVVYTKQPTPLVADSDSFTTVTGLPASCEDVIRLGAEYRMVPFLDVPHLTGASAEADFSSNMRPAGGASDLGRWLLQSYQLRLEQEASRLNQAYPVLVRYTF